MATVSYCTATDLEKRLSALGVSLRVDDDDTAKTECILEAAEDCDSFLGERYSQTQLALSAWVKYKCATIAVYYLCIRRGNPAPKAIQTAYDNAIKALERVQAGKAVVPGIQFRKAPAPVLSQPRVSLTPRPHVVIERAKSTGRPSGYTPNDDPFEPPIVN